MKKFNFLLLIYASLSYNFSLAQDPYLTKIYDNIQIEYIEVANAGGSITVIGDADNRTTVEVFVKEMNTSNSTDKLKKSLENYDIYVENNLGKLTCSVQSKTKMNWNNSVLFNFVIHTTEKVDLELTTAGGKIDLSKLEGNLQFKTSGGSIDLFGLKGNITGSTSGGSIAIDNAYGDILLTTSGGSMKAESISGSLKMTTSGGSIDLNQIQGKTIVRTSGGSIEAESVEGDLEAHTSGGSIQLSGIYGNIDAATSGGNIEVDVEQLHNYLKLSTSAGSINVRMPLDIGMDLNLQASRIKTPFTNLDGNITKEKIDASVNGGGALVQMKTSVGSITIN